MSHYRKLQSLLKKNYLYVYLLWLFSLICWDLFTSIYLSIIYNFASYLKYHFVISCFKHARKYQNGTPKVVNKVLMRGRPGTQFVTMVTKLVCSSCRAYLIDFWYKLAEISFSWSQLTKIRLSLWCYAGFKIWVWGFL